MFFKIAATLTVIFIIFLSAVIRDEIIKENGASPGLSYIMMASMSAAWVFWIIFLINQL